MNHRLFLYGTLTDPSLFEIVAGIPLEARPATLSGFELFWDTSEGPPLIVQRTGGRICGLLVNLDDATKGRVEFYARGQNCAPHDLSIECDDAVLTAPAFFPGTEHRPAGVSWSLADWQERMGPFAREAAIEYMRLIQTHSPEAAANAVAQIRSRAASRLRAYRHPTLAAFQPAMTAAQVHVQETRQPYTRYFAVREDDLVFPTFSGGESASVTRASFMGGDAVTVLPYDPALDQVLLVRQFRHGAFARGDANPWTLEPAAGRIDPGESPEEAACRELEEEAGIKARSLHRVADYYPSPGAYSEYLFSYVAIANLSGQDGATAGLDDEHEDIMSHVAGLDDLLEMIETGAANTGPLVLSALWLAHHRDTLRNAD